MQVVERGIDSGEVLLEDVATLLAVALLDCLADAADALFGRQHAADGEKAGLQDRIHPRPQPQALGHPARIDRKDAQALVQNVLLYGPPQMAPDIRGIIGGVDEDGCPFAGVAQDVHLVEKLEPVHAYEVS